MQHVKKRENIHIKIGSNLFYVYQKSRVFIGYYFGNGEAGNIHMEMLLFTYGNEINCQRVFNLQ